MAQDQSPTKLPLCRCESPDPYKSNTGQETNICQKCHGEIASKQTLNYSTWRLYKPTKRVRAQQLEDGYWEVIDGHTTIVLEDDIFKKHYTLAAQTQRLNKETGEYEYHTN